MHAFLGFMTGAKKVQLDQAHMEYIKVEKELETMTDKQFNSMVPFFRVKKIQKLGYMLAQARIVGENLSEVISVVMAKEKAISNTGRHPATNMERALSKALNDMTTDSTCRPGRKCADSSKEPLGASWELDCFHGLLRSQHAAR